jgi:uncharacterized protein (DUF2147 family)
MMSNRRDWSRFLTRRFPALLLVVCAALVNARAAFAVELESPVGRWITFDDETHAVRGVVRIFEKDGRLFGRIERAADRDDHEVCTACSDERKDQPLNGLVIIRNMRRGSDDPLVWEGGDVLDPDTGKVYRLKWRLESRGASLVVRGYLGVSLLGRSQTWARAPD